MKGNLMVMCGLCWMGCVAESRGAEEIIYELQRDSQFNHSWSIDPEATCGADGNWYGRIKGTFTASWTQETRKGVRFEISDIMFESESMEPRYLITGSGFFAELVDVPDPAAGPPHRASFGLNIYVNGGADKINMTADFPANSREFPEFAGSLMNNGGVLFGNGNCYLILVVARPASGYLTRFFRRADVNDDGQNDLGDPIRILVGLFVDPAAISCADAADIDDDGLIDVSDSIYMLNYLFLGGDFVPPPWPLCGIDLTEDQLDCAGQAACMS
jgi:hypothetical protein